MKKLTTNTLIALVCALPMLANAGLVVGDEFVLTFEATTGDFESTGQIGTGSDFGLGSFFFDLNAGAGGDVLEWTATAPGGLNNITGITISSLLFDDASTLIDFNVFSTVLPNLDFTLDATSISFSFGPIFEAGPGPILSGQFITPTTTVPEPGSLALLMLGLIGLRLRRSA